MAADNPHTTPVKDTVSPLQAGAAAATGRPAVSFDDDDDDDKFFHHSATPFELSEKNNIGARLSREIYVLGGGTVDATAQAFDEQHRAGTALEVAASFAVGLAVRAGEASLPALRPAIAVAGLAMTYAAGRDLLNHAAQISRITGDTWHYKVTAADLEADPQSDLGYSSLSHTDKKEQQFRDHERRDFALNGGRFALDLAIAGGAGMAGSSLGDFALFKAGGAGNYSRIPTYDTLGLLGKKSTPHNRLFNEDSADTRVLRQAEQSVLAFKATSTEAGKVGNVVRGNAFAISEDGLVVTNNHVISQRNNMTVTDHNGRVYDLAVLKTSVPDDLALLRATAHKAQDGPVSLRPLKLADHDAAAGEKVTALAHQREFGGVTLSPGRAVDFKEILAARSVYIPVPGQTLRSIRLSVHPLTREVTYTPPVKDLSNLAPSNRMLSTYFSKPGISGSPVVSEGGEVVAVHSGHLGRRWAKLTGRTSAIPVSSLHNLLKDT